MSGQALVEHDEHSAPGHSSVSGMTTLTEVKAWLADQLPTLIAKYDVPGAVVTVLVAMLLGAAGLVILVIGLVLRARGRRTPPTAAAA